jgi:hypothetical protein
MTAAIEGDGPDIPKCYGGKVGELLVTTGGISAEVTTLNDVVRFTKRLFYVGLGLAPHDATEIRLEFKVIDDG